jgi:hypothetical protein
MPRVRILIEEADIELVAELNESSTAGELWDASPLESAAQTWGAEVYFSVPLSCPLDEAQATVPSGVLGYWPPGRAVCLFFGQQPVSPVNVIGVLEGDPAALGAVQEGQTVRMERIEG